jgi:prefoldin subunit 5
MNKDFRKIDLKLTKASEIIVKLKTKYLSEPSIYADIHKIDERLEEISKIIKNDNSK